MVPPLYFHPNGWREVFASRNRSQEGYEPDRWPALPQRFGIPALGERSTRDSRTCSARNVRPHFWFRLKTQNLSWYLMPNSKNCVCSIAPHMGRIIRLWKSRRSRSYSKKSLQRVTYYPGTVFKYKSKPYFESSVQFTSINRCFKLLSIKPEIMTTCL